MLSKSLETTLLFTETVTTIINDTGKNYYHNKANQDKHNHKKDNHHKPPQKFTGFGEVCNHDIIQTLQEEDLSFEQDLK